MFAASTFRTRAGRAVAWAGSRPNTLERLLGYACLIGLGAALVLLILPLLVVGAVVAAVFGVRSTVRSILAGSREPNGLLDGRRNVRVVDPNVRREVI